MDYTRQDFEQRCMRVGRMRERLSDGYITEIGSDGLIRCRPRPRRPSYRAPWRGLFLSVITIICIKGALIAHLGMSDYTTRVERLEKGTTIDRVGAVLMHPEPLSLGIAKKLGPFL